MAAFEYRALDGRGKEKKGILEADTAKQIRQTLRDQKLTPLEVIPAAQSDKQVKGEKAPLFGGFFKPTISTTIYTTHKHHLRFNQKTIILFIGGVSNFIPINKPKSLKKSFK